MPYKAQLTKDHYLYLQFFVAETLGITLAHLKKNMSLEELYGWNAYFKLKGEREEKAYQDAQKKAQYRKVR